MNELQKLFWKNFYKQIIVSIIFIIILIAIYITGYLIGKYSKSTTNDNTVINQFDTNNSALRKTIDNLEKQLIQQQTRNIEIETISRERSESDKREIDRITKQLKTERARIDRYEQNIRIIQGIEQRIGNDEDGYRQLENHFNQLRINIENNKRTVKNILNTN